MLRSKIFFYCFQIIYLYLPGLICRCVPIISKLLLHIFLCLFCPSSRSIAQDIMLKEHFIMLMMALGCFVLFVILFSPLFYVRLYLVPVMPTGFSLLQGVTLVSLPKYNLKKIWHQNKSCGLTRVKSHRPNMNFAQQKLDKTYLHA